MVVYADVIWLLNFLVDSTLLWLTAILLKRNVKCWRYFIGGFIGSLIVAFDFTNWASFFGQPLVKIGFSFFMVLSVFGWKRWKYYGANLLTFYAVTFISGGLLIGMHYLLETSPTMSSSLFMSTIRGFGDPISWLFVIFGLPVAWLFTAKQVKTLEFANFQGSQLVEVQVKLNGHYFNVTGLVDTGNHLSDPLSQAPVMIISTASLKNKIPKELMIIAENPEPLISGSLTLEMQWMEKIRFIPAKSVGKNQQLLVAYKPEELMIEKERECYLVNKGLVAFTNQQLSSDSQFEAIVHPKMLMGTPIQHVS